MSEADLAIGARGATTWERLCLGLPSLVVTLAENQRPIAEELSRRGLVRWLGDAKDVGTASIAEAFSSIDSASIEEWSRQSREVVDGKGAGRVRGEMVKQWALPLHTRPVENH